jgi:hypothetical protein
MLLPGSTLPITASRSASSGAWPNVDGGCRSSPRHAMLRDGAREDRVGHEQVDACAFACRPRVRRSEALRLLNDAWPLGNPRYADDIESKLGQFAKG